MQQAKTRLSILKQKSKHDKNYKFKRLYRNLYNEDFYLRAYQKLYPKPGNMTPGVDNNTIDGFSKQQIAELIELIKTQRYHPKPAKRVYIPKKNGKKRPLGIPTFIDKLVQEVVREILEAIYEPIFYESSHGFRPNKSCHTALYHTKIVGRGTTWVIEGDITRCFETINHDILIELLSKKIQDGRLLELIRRFLKAGYMEFKQVYNSLSGTPQGNIISPILANIYLHEFDKYMEDLAKEHSKGTHKRLNPVYAKLYVQRNKAKRHNNVQEAKHLLKQMRSMPSTDLMDETFTRVRYIRYADDFLISIIGSKALALDIKSKITVFLGQRLGLELNQEKTFITNLAREKVRFLGYDITKAQCNTKLSKYKDGHKQRVVNQSIQLLVPGQVVRDKLKPFMKQGKPTHFTARMNYSVMDIISMYNAEVRGLYNYYCLAVNVGGKLAMFKYYHYGSLMKTIANKEKSSINSVIRKYGIAVPRKARPGTMRIVGCRYKTRDGPRTVTYFNESLKRVTHPSVGMSDLYGRSFGGGQLLKRLNANSCELCGSGLDIEVHHVRKLKEVKQKYRKQGKLVPYWVLTMAKIKRKTLIVCRVCHVKIHSGTLAEWF